MTPREGPYCKHCGRAIVSFYTGESKRTPADPALIAEMKRLVALAERATKFDLSTAEKVDEHFVWCPACDGQGEVDCRDYLHHDNAPVGVQVYGIGEQMQANDALVKAIPDMVAAIKRALAAMGET